MIPLYLKELYDKGINADDIIHHTIHRQLIEIGILDLIYDFGFRLPNETKIQNDMNLECRYFIKNMDDDYIDYFESFLKINLIPSEKLLSACDQHINMEMTLYTMKYRDIGQCFPTSLDGLNFIYNEDLFTSLMGRYPKFYDFMLKLKDNAKNHMSAFILNIREIDIYNIDFSSIECYLDLSKIINIGFVSKVKTYSDVTIIAYS